MLNRFQFLLCGGLENMKISVLYLMTIILLLFWCVGCSHRVPLQSGVEVKTMNPPATNTNDLEPKTNPDEKDEWKAYRSILSGNFTLINEDDFKSNMENLYKRGSKNGKCEWKYILMDFNKDGRDELFIQLTSDHDSALFRYADGKIKCIGIDNAEKNCFSQPLKGGRLLETYYYNGNLSKTIVEYDSEFKPVNQKDYYSITVDDYEYYKNNRSDIINEYPIITKEGVYYFQNIDGKKTDLSKEDWERIQKILTNRLYLIASGRIVLNLAKTDIGKEA